MIQAINELLANHGVPITALVVLSIGVWRGLAAMWKWFKDRDHKMWDLVVNQNKANHEELIKALDKLTDKLDKR